MALVDGQLEIRDTIQRQSVDNMSAVIWDRGVISIQGCLCYYLSTNLVYLFIGYGYRNPKKKF